MMDIEICEDCPSCIGTGISPVGRVDDPCESCRGTGVDSSVWIDNDDNFDPDDYDHDKAEEVMWGGVEDGY